MKGEIKLNDECKKQGRTGRWLYKKQRKEDIMTTKRRLLVLGSTKTIKMDSLVAFLAFMEVMKHIFTEH